MKRTLMGFGLLALTAVSFGGQTEDLAALRVRIEANLQKIQTLHTQIGLEGAADSALALTLNQTVTTAYNTGNALPKITQALPGLEAKTKFISMDGSNVVITGANLEVRAGQGFGFTGLGNVVVGHNQLRPSGNNRVGMHNLVFGDMANYSKQFGIVGGRGNNLLAPHSVILTGESNTVSGDDLFQVILTGKLNSLSANAGVILTGNNNSNTSVRSILGTGSFNSIAGGYENVLLTGESAAITSSDRSTLYTGLRTRIHNATFAAMGTGIDKTNTASWSLARP